MDPVDSLLENGREWGEKIDVKIRANDRKKESTYTNTVIVHRFVGVEFSAPFCNVFPDYRRT